MGTKRRLYNRKFEKKGAVIIPVGRSRPAAGALLAAIPIRGAALGTKRRI
jgi:hypothetical protein